MEHCPVIIVGGGPSGLALGLTLARWRVHSVILEKETGIHEDPRGVVLAGDAVRIAYDLGAGDQMAWIGHEIEGAKFHTSNFQNEPFLLDDTSTDRLHQAVAEVVIQVQPKLELVLRRLVASSSFCQLREGCEVVGREELSSGLVVEYMDRVNKLKKRVQCEWLVGADGKRGIVRKHFLEKEANIHQETGLYSYDGTWIAANLHINLPTPQSHPKFPLWELGYNSQEVYDLFWPKQWHFVSPPGPPTACGRFGPHEDRIWRHEIDVANWNDSMDGEALLMENVMVHLTRRNDEDGKPLAGGQPVCFPRDCIEILRCRPFTFTQKVVNKWFHKRTILIGDAAHVFPPFGGQGIACGFRDAFGLGWRLAVLLQEKAPPANSALLSERLLTPWSLERRQGVDDSTRLTLANGTLCNNPQAALSLPELEFKMDYAEETGYKPTKEGFYLPQFGGGGKLAQVYLQSADRGPFLSDQLLHHGALFTVLMLLKYNKEDVDGTEALKVIRDAGLPEYILSASKSAVHVDPDTTRKPDCPGVFSPVPEKDLQGVVTVRPGYDEHVYVRRLGQDTKFAIIRPDHIIFALAKSTSDLRTCLASLKGMLAV